MSFIQNLLWSSMSFIQSCWWIPVTSILQKSSSLLRMILCWCLAAECLIFGASSSIAWISSLLASFFEMNGNCRLTSEVLLLLLGLKLARVNCFDLFSWKSLFCWDSYSNLVVFIKVKSSFLFRKCSFSTWFLSCARQKTEWHRTDYVKNFMRNFCFRAAHGFPFHSLCEAPTLLPWSSNCLDKTFETCHAWL